MAINTTGGQILHILADGKFHSGDDIGAVLGISRAAVSKSVKSLKEKSIEIFSLHGKGYQLVGGADFLDRDSILVNINDKCRDQINELFLHLTIESTNNYLMSKAEEGAGKGLICFSEHQTAGKGRRGRHWVSPFAKNIYLSILWQFDGGAAELEGLSLAIGVAVARAVKKLGVNGVALKWPNDVLLDNKKLAGVLLEMTGDVSGECKVVIGVGLNLFLSDADGQSIDQPYTALSQYLSRSVGRSEVAAILLSEILLILMDFEEKGFSSIRDEWQSYDALLQQWVTLSSVGKQVSGISCGIDRDGGLLVDIDGDIKVFKGGEVSIRKAEVK